MGRADSPLRDRVIFVDGAPRSGTTWLVTLLATHPQIAGVQAESHLFDFGTDRLFDNIENRHPTLHGLRLYLDREELVDLTRELCDGIFLAMRRHVSGATTPEFVVEKTPVGARADGLDLERKRDCYPDAWYIHIVRDREAVTRSLMHSPFMADRSHAACAGLWDRVVGDIRRCLGGVPRYREVSYEALRADPAATCRELFEWIGVDAGDEVLETARVLSQERFSEMGAPPDPARTGRFTRPRRVLAEAADGVRRRVAKPPEPPRPEDVLTFRFVEAMHQCDLEALRSLCHPKLEVVHRRPDGDASLRGEAAHQHLAQIAREAFGRRYVGEWWGSPGSGPGEWWTSAPGKPFSTVFFSGLGGDASRIDVALGLTLEDELIARVVVISAGPLSGRPIAGHAEAASQLH